MRVIIDGVEETEGGHLVNPDIDNPDIDGGTIDNTPIGQTTPAAGAFTELKASTDPVDEHGVGDQGFSDARYRDVYKTIYIDAAEMIPATTSGSLQGTTEWPTNDVDIDQLAFDGGMTPERAQFKIKFPENWDLGTLKAKFDWTGAAGCTAGDTVEWRIKAKAVRDSDAIDAAMGTLQLIVDTIIENDGTDWQTSGATPSLTVGGTLAAGCTVLFEVDRNGPGTDTLAEDALLYGLTIQYKLSGAVAAW